MSEGLMETGEGSVSLADLAGLDMAEVEEVRFVLTPAGVFLWEVADSKLTMVTRKQVEVPAAVFELKCLAVEHLADEEAVAKSGKTADDLIGIKHTETMVIKTVDDLGRIKAFMVDAGFPGASGALQEVVVAMKGHQFRGPIRHSPDRNDKSIVYANLDRTKLAPAE